MTDEQTPAKNENSDKITLDSFVELVKQMRHNQRRYARTHKPEILATLEPLEKEVDAIVAKLTDTQLQLWQEINISIWATV